ncbi:MAG TPA: molybdate ABC transporter permease subunit [Longimicrobiales bacterium]|nr:molybdate ABC transporter permease subunit [Longimicrobiales bacterium]
MSPLQLSGLVTVVATTAIVAVGVPLAWLLARQRLPGGVLIETLILLPLVLPPSVVGYYLLMGLGEAGPLAAVGVRLLFTWQGAAVASAVVGLPLLVKSGKAAFASVDAALEDAARVCGSSEWEVFTRVTLPLARRGLAAGVVLAAARAFGEFGATLMVAGSIPGRTQTLPLAIYDAVQAGRYADAHTLVLLTSVLAFLSLLLVARLERDSVMVRPHPVMPRGGP